jgi:hypothetical protein
MQHRNSKGRQIAGPKSESAPKVVANDQSVTPIGVSPKTAFQMLGCGVTKGYEFIGNHDLETYKIGRATRITLRSIHQLVDRLVAESNPQANRTPPEAA